MTGETKVTAVIDKEKVTIDQNTGVVERRREGVFRGFGQGFTDYVMKGPQTRQNSLEVNVGKFPAGHKAAGKWCVQVMVYPFAEQDDANTIADRLARVVDQALRSGV